MSQDIQVDDDGNIYTCQCTNFNGIKMTTTNCSIHSMYAPYYAKPKRELKFEDFQVAKLKLNKKRKQEKK